MGTIIEYIKQAFALIKNLVVKVINGCVNFVKHIVGWFKGLNLIQKRDVPFIANANSQEFREMLKHAPIKNANIFEGVYNEETGKITHHTYLDADSVDQQTSDVLKNDNLVVLQ